VTISAVAGAVDGLAGARIVALGCCREPGEVLAFRPGMNPERRGE